MATDTTSPGFLGSVISGIVGAFKGAFAGASVGAVTGGAIAGVIALVVTGGAAAIPVAAVGATLVGGLFGAIGAMAGTVTEVVKSQRPPAGPSTEELVQLGEVSFEKGVSRGLELAKEQEETKWRDKMVNEQAAKAVQGSDKVH